MNWQKKLTQQIGLHTHCATIRDSKSKRSWMCLKRNSAKQTEPDRSEINVLWLLDELIIKYCFTWLLLQNLVVQTTASLFEACHK